MPLANNSEINVTDYRAMVRESEKSGYMSNETHCREFNRWFDEISTEKATQNA